MALKVNSLFFIKLPLAGMIVGFLTSIVGFLNVVDLIGALIAFDDREPSLFLINSHESTEIIGWEIFGYLLFMFSGCFLVLGTIKNSHKMIIPWLIVSAIVILLGIGCALFLLVFLIQNFESDLWRLIQLVILGIFIAPGLSIYTWIGIFSLYQTVREKNQEVIQQDDAEKLNLNKIAN